MPSCDIFVDVFGGSGSVLNAMKNKSKTRYVFNDIDHNIYNFFNVLQKFPNELAHKTNLTPYSRQLFNEACERIKSADQVSPIDLAVLFLIVNRQSFGSKMEPNWSITRDGEVNYQTWNKLPKMIMKIYNRWKTVFLENLDYKDLIKKWDSPSTTFYLDPPYEGVEEDYYDVNKKDGFDHQAMFNALQNIEGSYAISYYGGVDLASDPDLVKQYSSAGCLIMRTKVIKHLAGKVEFKKPNAVEVMIIKTNKYSTNSKRIKSIKGRLVGDFFQ